MTLKVKIKKKIKIIYISITLPIFSFHVCCDVFFNEKYLGSCLSMAYFRFEVLRNLKENTKDLISLFVSHLEIFPLFRQNGKCRNSSFLFIFEIESKN